MTDKMTRDEVMAEIRWMGDAASRVRWSDRADEDSLNLKLRDKRDADAIDVVSALFDEVEAQQRWIDHLCAFIGPGAMPGLLFSFEAGLPAGGADQRIKGGA